MLPKIDLPIFDLTIPSTGKVIKVRPFIVKEEKLLLMAVESGDDREIINVSKQVINNCIISGKADVETLPFFDVDYIFITLRAKSVGESIDLKFTCNNETENGPCNNVFPAKLDISKYELRKNEEIKNPVVLGGGMTFKMKYPTYEEMKIILENDSDFDKKIKIIVNSIESIQNKDKIYSAKKDMTKQELEEFVTGLTKAQYSKLEEFVDNFPYFVVVADATCDKCGKHHHIEYNEFTSFFV